MNLSYGRATVLALLFALGCDAPPKPGANGKTAPATAAKPAVSPNAVTPDKPTEPPPPVADAGGTTPAADGADEPDETGEPEAQPPKAAGPATDPAASPAARKDAVLALLRGGDAVDALPVVDVDPGSTFDTNLVARLQPREAPKFRLDRGAPTVTGGLNSDIVRRIIRARSGTLSTCYQAELKAKPTLSGRLGLTFQISAAGAVTKVDVTEDSLGSGADRGSGKNGIGKCFAKKVGRWRFPKSPDGTTTDVVNTFSLGGF